VRNEEELVRWKRALRDVKEESLKMHDAERCGRNRIPGFIESRLSTLDFSMQRKVAALASSKSAVLSKDRPANRAKRTHPLQFGI
jgi:hypothetical protein